MFPLLSEGAKQVFYMMYMMCHDFFTTCTLCGEEATMRMCQFSQSDTLTYTIDIIVTYLSGHCEDVSVETMLISKLGCSSQPSNGLHKKVSRISKKKHLPGFDNFWVPLKRAAEARRTITNVDPLRRWCVSDARNLGETAIVSLRGQPSAEIVRRACRMRET